MRCLMMAWRNVRGGNKLFAAMCEVGRQEFNFVWVLCSLCTPLHCFPVRYLSFPIEFLQYIA